MIPPQRATSLTSSFTSRSRKGDSTTNIIIFLTLVVAGLVVSTWYMGSVRPTRQIIGSVADDMDGIGRHISNACSVTKYRGTFQPSTTSAVFVTNSTHYCITTDVFGSCESAVCDIESTTIPFARGSLVTVTREKDDIVRFNSSNVVPSSQT